MKIEHIIIQAGGLGLRLGKLTKNKPKCIVAVKNRPLIFHVFERYPQARFIIIGDYKYPVLENYLRVFSKIDYQLVRAGEKGNAAGIRDALDHIPENASFILMWSDILLSEDLCLKKIPNGNYIGLTKMFPCSWHMENGRLSKEPGDNNNGVAGFFIFKDKSVLDNLSEQGSFMAQVRASDIVLTPLDMLDSREFGTIDAIRETESRVNRCRPYNALEFYNDTVKKIAITDDGQKILEKEITWYRKMQKYGFPYIPKIISYTPLTMSYIRGENIFNANISENEKQKTIKQLVDILELMHSYEIRPADTESLNIEYYEKTLTRLDSVKTVIPFADSESIIINGRICRNVLFFRKDFHKLIEGLLFNTIFCPIHGDATLTNIMIDETGSIRFIDARGYFGKNEVFGDIYYDWSKLYYSIKGNFDSFNVKDFDLEINKKEVNYHIRSNGWEHLTDYFFSLINNCDASKIKLIHAIIWLSLSSHCWEDYDSLCAAFYNGISLLEDCFNETR